LPTCGQALTRRLDRWRPQVRAEVEELALRLDRYVKGAGRWLFQSAGKVPPALGATAFVMADLSEEDRAPAMFLVLNHIWSALGQNRRPAFLVVEEGWRLMRYPDTALFVQTLAKGIRKRGGGLTLVTQDVGDVLASPVGEAVVTSSATQVLMRQAVQAMPRLADLFQLTQAEQSWLLSAQRGEGLLLAAGKRVPFRAVASDEEDRVIQQDWRDEVAA